MTTTEKLVFNLNRFVYVRLTDKGLQYLRDEYAAFWERCRGVTTPSHYTPPAYVEPKPDADGYYAFQLHAFIDKFAPLMSPGCDLPAYFKDATDIFLEKAHVKPMPTKPHYDVRAPGLIETGLGWTVHKALRDARRDFPDGNVTLQHNGRHAHLSLSDEDVLRLLLPNG